MNKSSYYYKKLGQSILFSDMNWRDIVDDNDPHDNVFSEEFLTSFNELLRVYYKKECLEEAEIKNLFTLLSDLRTYYPYQTRTEKETIFAQINDMIRLGNRISSDGTYTFYLEEYKKRYGTIQNERLKNFMAYYYIHILDGDIHAIKQDLAHDIYPLTLLFHTINELTDDHLHIFLLSECLLSTINAICIENPECMKDPSIRKRFLWLLEKNNELLKNKEYQSSGDVNDDMIFKIQNHLLLKRLQKIK